MRWLGVMALALLASANLAWADDAGEAVFRGNCIACHSLTAGINRVGPSLAAVVGRPAGSISGYAYSAAMANSGITWTEDRLDAFLSAPQAVVPGTKMTFMGLKDPKDRADVIAYLKVSTTPLPAAPAAAQ